MTKIDGTPNKIGFVSAAFSMLPPEPVEAIAKAAHDCRRLLQRSSSKRLSLFDLLLNPNDEEQKESLASLEPRRRSLVSYRNEGLLTSHKEYCNATTTAAATTAKHCFELLVEHLHCHTSPRKETTSQGGVNGDRRSKRGVNSKRQGNIVI